jgi:hypothetical protein
MVTRRQKKMVNLEVDETSGVDHPAHKAEGWVVVKSADNASLAEALEELVGGTMSEDQEITEEVAKKMYNDLEAANKRIVEMEDEMDKMRTEMDKMRHGKKKMDKPSDEDMLKSADPVVQEIVAKAMAEAQELRKALDEANEEKIQKQYVEKAAKWTNLNEKSEVLGSMLRKVASFDTDVADALEGLLDAVNGQAESAAIFEELGTGMSGDSDGTALGRVQSLAKAAVEQGEYKTFEQAVSGLVAKNPSLYAEYLSETR